MRSQTPHEHVVAVEHEVLDGDGRPQPSALVTADIGHGLLGGDVLHDHPQRGKALAQGVEHVVDKPGFAVEDVDLGVGDLAVGQQRNAAGGHALDHRIDPGQIAHAGVRVGGCPGGVELDGRDQPRIEARFEVVGVGGLGQVERHQRGEVTAARDRLTDAVGVGLCVGGGPHRRHEVGHDDGPAEVSGGMGEHGPHHLTVTQVQMPVIGAGNRQGLGQVGAHGAGLDQALQARNPRVCMAQTRFSTGLMQESPCRNTSLNSSIQFE